MEEQRAVITLIAEALVGPDIKPYSTNEGVTGFILPNGRILRPFIVFEVADGHENYDITSTEAAALGVQIVDYPTTEVVIIDVARRAG